jgi:hypothetical protein
MKTSAIQVVGVCLISTLSATIAQSKFSGIYPGIAGAKEKVLLSITKGGHVFGIGNSGKGLKEAIDPNKSTISADGKLKAVVPDGTSISGTVSANFEFKGTVKDSEGTSRITATRTLN